MTQYSSQYYCPHCRRLNRKTRMLALNEEKRIWYCEIHKNYTKPATNIGIRYAPPAPVEVEPRIGITSDPAPVSKGDKGDRGLPGPQGPSGLESGGKIYVQPERPLNLTPDDIWFETND